MDGCILFLIFEMRCDVVQAGTKLIRLLKITLISEPFISSFQVLNYKIWHQTWFECGARVKPRDSCMLGKQSTNWV